MNESQFRSDETARKGLLKCLDNQHYRNALSIVINKRRVLERQFEIDNLNGDERQSLRLFNQRLGMEGLIIDLYEMTIPMAPPPEEVSSTYGADEAMRRLQELQDAANQHYEP